MTCFWNGILTSLDNATINSFLHRPYNDPKPRAKEFVQLLKRHNTQTNNVLWNDTILSQRELEENFTHIKNYNENSIYQGYDCSTCDPFLLLIAQLFSVNIQHNYNGYTVHYKVKNNKGIRLLKYKSNRGHFWLEKS